MLPRDRATVRLGRHAVQDRLVSDERSLDGAKPLASDLKSLQRLWRARRDDDLAVPVARSGSWSPPPCPEDSPSRRFRAILDGGLTPAGPQDAEAASIGSIWRTTRLASVVVAVRYGNRVTLALLVDQASRDDYTLAIGSRLRLLATYDPSRDPNAKGLDQALYYGYLAGHGYRRYEILDGPCAGRVIELPAGEGPYWMPPSALAAHGSLEMVIAEAGGA